MIIGDEILADMDWSGQVVRKDGGQVLFLSLLTSRERAEGMARACCRALLDNVEARVISRSGKVEVLSN